MTEAQLKRRWVVLMQLDQSKNGVPMSSFSSLSKEYEEATNGMAYSDKEKLVNETEQRHGKNDDVAVISSINQHLVAI